MVAGTNARPLISTATVSCVVMGCTVVRTAVVDAFVDVCIGCLLGVVEFFSPIHPENKTTSTMISTKILDLQRGLEG
jgi:hypothetical protein